MKNDYLNELRSILENHNVDPKDVKEIISDYDQLYNEGLDKSMTDGEIRELLGEPQTVFEDLKDTLHMFVERHSSRTLVKLIPLLAIVSYLVVGIVWHIWTPTWLVFLLIPIAGILENKNGHKLIALLPFILIIAVVLTAYFTSEWKYAWLLILIFPFIASFKYKHLASKIIFNISLISATVFYILIIINHGHVETGLLGFLLPLVLGILLTRNWLDIFNNMKTKLGVVSTFLSICAFLAFLLVGLFVTHGFSFSWQFLLLIPIFTIATSKHFKWASISPFIAVIIFFSLGHFFGLFYISWIAFFIIPITGIIEGNNKKIIDEK